MGQDSTKQNDNYIELATFGAGCFWCVEAIFKETNGVLKVVPGYTGGITENPSYQEVCTGETGHAEVAQITYDKSVVSFSDLLEIFWGVHDPTTLNKQGDDVGTQYRSAIFYHNEEQKKLAEYYKEELNKSETFDNPIVTEISPTKEFFPAEKYHQNYYNDNTEKSYCQLVISPKLNKFRNQFKSKRKNTSD